MSVSLLPPGPAPVALLVCSNGALLHASAQVSRQTARGMLVQEGDCAQGTSIKSGTPIRLQHMNTRRWLHSHKFPSPLSGNQEVRMAGREHRVR